MLVLGILLIAANLRGPVTAVAPVLADIQAYFGLDNASAGLLITLPLLMFAVVSLFAAGLAARWGLERTLGAGVGLILAGIALRVSGSVAALFAGTLVIAGGIALCNVLLPGLVKREFPQRVALLTSSYALVMGSVAALGSTLAIPLAQIGGWRLALASVAAVALLSLLVWSVQLGGGRAGSARSGQRYTGIWRHALAWQVTLFLGLNSFVYYTMISWLPSILHATGYSAAAAGGLHGLMQLGSALAALVVAPMVRYSRDQRGPALLTSLTAMGSLVGLWLLPQWSGAWSLLFGFGNGAVFILALSFVGLRVSTPAQAAALSGMAQCVGYLLAAAGPTLMGHLHDLQGSWTPVLLLCLALNVAMAAIGLLAGRNRQIA